MHYRNTPTIGQTMRPLYEYDTDDYTDPDAQQDARDDFYAMEVPD